MPDDISQVLNNFKNLINSNSTESNTSSEHIEHNNSNNSSNNNFTITPEIISNLSEAFKNYNTNASNGTQDTDTANNSSDNSNSSNSQIDFDTILKIKSIMEKLNKKDDPRSNLLYSLKPYLRESRQRKIDEYSNLLKIVSISDIFQNK